MKNAQQICFERNSHRFLRFVFLVAFVAMISAPDVSAQRKRSKKKRAPRHRITAIQKLTVVQEQEVASGVRYVEYRSNGRVPVDIHVVYLDRTIPSNAIRIVKGEDRYDGKESVVSMSKRYSDVTNSEVLALINANFWRAVRNTAIGPCHTSHGPVPLSTSRIVF